MGIRSSVPYSILISALKFLYTKFGRNPVIFALCNTLTNFLFIANIGKISDIKGPPGPSGARCQFQKPVHFNLVSSWIYISQNRYNVNGKNV